MAKGFKLPNLISFNISHHFHHRTNNINNHLDSPLISRLFSSSYNNNNRSNDNYSSNRPPPRRHSTDTDDRVGRGRENTRDFDNNRLGNDGRSFRRNNRASSPDSNRPEGNNTSFVPFDDNLDHEQSAHFSKVSNNKVGSKKVEDVDGFLDRFKLGFDKEEKNKMSNVEDLGGKRGGEGEGVGKEMRVEAPEDADEIFRKMKETGLIPNAVAMLHGLCNDGLVQEAMKLFGVMREKGSIPEVVIYTAVVEGFCKADKADEGVRIFRKMQSNGIVPNAFSYGVIVQGLVNGKRLDDGLEFCLEMVEAGHSPNLATFTGLVSVFCRERGLESARIVMGNLKDKGFGFDEKGVRDFMEKKGPFSRMVWEAIFGKKSSEML